MYDVCAESPPYGEEFWLVFFSKFREHSIRNMEDGMIKKWIDLLHNRGVFVERRRHFSKRQTLLDIWNSEIHVPAKNGSAIENESRVEEEEAVNDIPQTSGENVEHPAQRLTDHAEMNEEGTANNASSIAIQHERNNESFKKSTGISGFMRAFQGRKQFSGAFDEDLISVFEIFWRKCVNSHQSKSVRHFPSYSRKMR